MRTRGTFGLLLALGVLTGVAPAAQAADAPAAEGMDQTPPRLSFLEGQVSFWRPGAQDWALAQVNTPLAPGDELATGSPGNLEVQIGARAFVRAWASSQLGLATHGPDFLQFTVTAGRVSFDLRTLAAGSTVEVDTPNAAFTIEHAGYYRVEVTGERTAFITRRAGRATVTPASGEAVAITPSEEVIIAGTGSPQVTSYVAPPLDAWDRWNYARTDRLFDAVSGRYVSPGTYGVSDLDPYGTWRVVPTYGPVWVPTAVATGWVPYSTGAWILDPFYGWTWVDTAPWGWAPYHYGRWVFVDGFWAWAPGPVVIRAVYAPALVAFFGEPGVGSIGLGGPVVGWVALGWGEPLVPWWGRAGFAHAPSWRGWGGPRVVNNIVINNTTIVNVQNIAVYRNTSVPNAVVVVHEKHFGHGPLASLRVTNVDVQRLQSIHAAPQVATTPGSFVPTASRGIRPPEETVKRPVVAIRPHEAAPGSGAGGERIVGPAGVVKPAPRLVSVPPEREPAPVLRRPPFGPSPAERPVTDRPRAPSPPTGEAPSRPGHGTVPPPMTRPTPAPTSPVPRRELPRVGGPAPAVPTPPAPRPELPRVGGPPPMGPASPAPHPEQLRMAGPSQEGPAHRVQPPRLLPGEPANRLSPTRVQGVPPQPQ